LINRFVLVSLYWFSLRFDEFCDHLKLLEEKKRIRLSYHLRNLNVIIYICSFWKCYDGKLSSKHKEHLLYSSVKTISNTSSIFNSTSVQLVLLGSVSLVIQLLVRF